MKNQHPDDPIVITATAQPLPRQQPLHADRPEDEPEELFNWRAIGRAIAFMLHSVGRHKLLFFGVWVGVIAASLLAMAVLPKTYHVETTLQAQRNQVISSLSNPNRSMPLDADAPTRQAAETVMRHDNLVALINQTDLIKRWPLNRAPLMHLKDLIWPVLFTPQPPDEQVENFVYFLATRLWVVTGDGTITIGIDWPDPKLAYQLVETALQNFLDARHAADVSSIAEAITILETRAGQAYQTLSASLQQLQAAREARAARLGKQARRAAPQPQAAPLANPEGAQLLIQLQGKRRAISDLEEFRRRRISELQTRLAEQRAIYSDNHPVVLDIQQSIEALNHDSPQVIALRRELAALEEEIKKRGLPVDSAGETRIVPVTPRVAQLESEDPLEAEDQQIEYAKEQVRYDLTKYNSFLDRIEGARLELDTARAAFKYRYIIIQPVQKPRRPTKPKPALVLGSSLLAGLFLAIAATGLRDLQSRRLIETWQIEHALNLPLLGEVRPR